MGLRVRRRPREDDPERIVAHHAAVYTAEHELDAEFERHVRAAVGAAVARGWPGRSEAVWIAELDGEHAGSLALTDEGAGTAALRWFVLDPALRGQGLGWRLVSELVSSAERLGYRLLVLETFSELHAAARIYRGHGFELRSAETGPRWGRDQLTYQHYELELASGRRTMRNRDRMPLAK